MSPLLLRTSLANDALFSQGPWLWPLSRNVNRNGKRAVQSRRLKKDAVGQGLREVFCFHSEQLFWMWGYHVASGPIFCSQKTSVSPLLAFVIENSSLIPTLHHCRYFCASRAEAVHDCSKVLLLMTSSKSRCRPVKQKPRNAPHFQHRNLGFALFLLLFLKNHAIIFLHSLFTLCTLVLTFREKRWYACDVIPDCTSPYTVTLLLWSHGYL